MKLRNLAFAKGEPSFGLITVASRRDIIVPCDHVLVFYVAEGVVWFLDQCATKEAERVHNSLEPVFRDNRLLERDRIFWINVELAM